MITLLDIVSTRGDLSFLDFNKAFDSLYTEYINGSNELKYMRRQMMYWLDSLGHCEIDFTKRRIYVCKPCISLLPGVGCREAILTGSRDKQLLTKLKQLQKEYKHQLLITDTPQVIDNISLPSVITLQAIDQNMFVIVANQLGIDFVSNTPASWLIANASGSIFEYEVIIKYKKYSPLNWPKRYFSVQQMRFKRNIDQTIDTFLVEYTNTVTQQKIHYWVKGNFAAIVDRNWARYLAIKNAGKNVLKYDERKQLLAIPFYAPLPGLMSRAATLCSGQVAIKTNNVKSDYPVYIYRGVSNSIAGIIAQKLSQELVHTVINLKKEEEWEEYND